MHIKRIHEMVEELTECTLSAIKANESHVGDFAIPDVIDMIKDLCCAEKDAREAKEKEKEEEDEKKENEYFLKMLKEEYGEEEGERRFYSGQPRSRTSGRFMRRGDGRRRGYEEPPYLHMPYDYRYGMDGYEPTEAERMRDLDRRRMNKMYYTDGGSGGSYGGNSGGNSGQSGNMGGSGMSGGQSGSGNSGGSRGYSDGYDEGSRRGYEDGYRDGERSGRSSGGRRDGREGRSGQSRRSYMETKEANRGNSPQEKQEKMKELEKYMGELGSDITEMISDASPEERALLKQKMQMLVQKLG